jgi:hypothetical protein
VKPLVVQQAGEEPRKVPSIKKRLSTRDNEADLANAWACLPRVEDRLKKTGTPQKSQLKLHQCVIIQ